MGKQQVNTGRGNQTVNTNNVWDRIVALEENGVPNLSGELNGVKSQLAEITTQVSKYGAKGDGTSDDLSSIQSAIDYVSSKGGGTVFLSGNHKITNSIKPKSNVAVVGTKVSKISGASTVKPFVCLSTDAVSNFKISDITFDGLNQNELEGINGIEVSNCKFLNSQGNGLGWLKACKNVKVKDNLIDTTPVSNMGMKIEGTSAGSSDNIEVSGNLCINTGDNGIAVRAINGSVSNVTITRNIVVNAGKAGIKLTIESTSAAGVSIKDGVISNNVVNGWGKYVSEDAISCNSFKAGQYIENVSVVGNSLEAITANTLQRGYIGVSINKKTVVSANACVGKVQWNGIWCESSQEVIINANHIEGACQDSAYAFITSLGGIGLINSIDCVVASNKVKNTGTVTVNRPGIYVNKSWTSNISNNRCFDDQATKTQSYGIEEANSGGDPAWSKDNLFIGNHCKGNVTANILISARSQQFGNFA